MAQRKGVKAKDMPKYDLPMTPAPLGMVAGLPSGLNSTAIRMLLKQMGIEMGEEAPKAVGPTSRALKDAIERRGANVGPPGGISERRMGELMNLFGGTKK